MPRTPLPWGASPLDSMAGRCPWHVKLPDGSPLELEAGATGADAAAAIGPGLAKAALAVRVDGGDARPRGAARRRRGDRDRHGPQRRRPRPDPPRRRPRDGDGGRRALSRDEGLDRAADRGRLLLRLRVPRGRHGHRGRLRARSRRRCASTSPPTRPSSAPTDRVAEALERFEAEEQPYKVELIEDLVANEGVETVSLYRNGPFTDLCRGPARAVDGPDRGDQAELGRRRLLARRRDPPDAHPDLRDGVLLEEGPERAPRADRAGAGATTTASSGPSSGSSRSATESPGMPFWLPHGTVLLRLIERGGATSSSRSAATRRSRRPQILDEELWHRSGH